MIKQISTTFVWASLLLVAGCATKQSAPLGAVPDCAYPDNPTQAAPTWVCSAPVDGIAMSAVGSYQKSGAGHAFMMDQATADARFKLASTLRTQVQGMVDRYAATTGAGANETVDLVNKTVSRQTTDGILQGARVLRTATSSRGDLYVLVALDKPQLEKATVGVLKVSMNNAPAVYQKIEAAKAQKELSAEIGKQRDDVNRVGTRSQDAIISDIMRIGAL